MWARWVQQRLIQWGYELPVRGVDGQFNDETVAVMRQFQRDHGLGTGEGLLLEVYVTRKALAREPPDKRLSA